MSKWMSEANSRRGNGQSKVSRKVYSTSAKGRLVGLFTNRGKNDIYVTKRTNFKAQLNRCEKLFNDGVFQVVLHAVGTAINRACHLALYLRELHHSSIELDIKTSTARLIDDLEPLNDQDEYEMSVRRNSTIHIRLLRREDIGSFGDS